MHFEFIELNAYLAGGKSIKKYDYIYFHTVAGYPLKKDFDTKDYYLINEINSITGIIHALRIGGENVNSNVTFTTNQFSGNWWILSYPDGIKEQIFPSLK
nr:hypothetical protein [Flavobacterium sp. ASV13]